MTNGLQKILTELKAEKPRIDYVIGILETLIEMENPLGIDNKKVEYGTIVVPTHLEKAANEIVGNEPKDEGAILDAQTKARIDAVKALAEKSTEIA